jgi:NAD(P)-dependent dehydrogenase (short-subunit alcohol dehydrogenase family)
VREVKEFLRSTRTARRGTKPAGRTVLRRGPFRGTLIDAPVDRLWMTESTVSSGDPRCDRAKRGGSAASSANRTALVTGCSTGIGRATADAFLDDGWAVFATDREDRPLDGLAERGARTVAVDVTSDSDVAAVVDGLVAEEGHIDCLVNNAGYGQLGAVGDVPTDRVVRQFDVNVFGAHRLVRAVLPHMLSRGSGLIVNVSSVVDRLPLPGIGVYSASKAAVLAMSDALRRELRGTGVDVVVVEPWIVATDFFERAVGELAHVDRRRGRDELYRVLESLAAIDEGTPSVTAPSATARTVLRAASEGDPRPYYRVGPWATAGVVVAPLLRGRAGDRTARIGLDALSRLVGPRRDR